MRFLIKYEAPPIREVVKIKVIEAKTKKLAKAVFLNETDNVAEIFSIEMLFSV